jgi:hypothetical protein
MASGAEQQVFNQVFRFVRPIIWPERDEGIGGAHHRQGGPGNIENAGHVEPPQIGRLLQLGQPLKQHGLNGVSGSPRSVRRLGGLLDVGAIEFVRHNIEEQSGDMALENLSDLYCGGQTRVVSGASIEPEPSRP